MKVVITGASGNVLERPCSATWRSPPPTGPSWVCALRRPPSPGEPAYDRVSWVRCETSPTRRPRRS